MNHRIGIHMQPKLIAECGDLIRQFSLFSWHQKRDVLHNAECFKQREVLEYHAYPQRLGVGRFVQMYGRSIPIYCAAVGFLDAVNHLHQAGFTRPVLT